MCYDYMMIITEDFGGNNRKKAKKCSRNSNNVLCESDSLQNDRSAP